MCVNFQGRKIDKKLSAQQYSIFTLPKECLDKTIKISLNLNPNRKYNNNNFLKENYDDDVIKLNLIHYN